MKIFLVRHGQDEDNALGVLNGSRDTVLTKLGIEQVNSAALKLKDRGINYILASPLKRAYQTAQIISRVIGVEKITVDPLLAERDFGILTGKPIADIPRYAGRVINVGKINYFLEADGAETFPALYSRARKILSNLKRIKPNQNILLVTHGDLGMMIRGAFYDLGWKESLQAPYIHNAEIIELLSNKHV